MKNYYVFFMFFSGLVGAGFGALIALACIFNIVQTGSLTSKGRQSLLFIAFPYSLVGAVCLYTGARLND